MHAASSHTIACIFACNPFPLHNRHTNCCFAQKRKQVSAKTALFQKYPRVRKIRVRKSGAGNGCAKFMDTWKNAFFLQENLHVHKIPRFGGGILGLGGWECRIYFYGRGDFLTFVEEPKRVPKEEGTKMTIFQSSENSPF